MNSYCRLIYSIALLVASYSSEAAPASYTCIVTHVYALTDNGSLNPSGFEKSMNGGTFSVSRVTGNVVGEVVPTLMATSTLVINPGSKENSFKTLANFEGQVQVIEVQEFKDLDMKPFVAFSMGGAGIVTGKCK